MRGIYKEDRVSDNVSIDFSLGVYNEMNFLVFFGLFFFEES